MKKLWMLVCALILASCVVVAPPAPAPSSNVFMWNGDVAKLKIQSLEGNGSCSGWMITDTELVTAGHCAAQLISMTACFYPEFDPCANPVALTLRGVDTVRDVAVFMLPKGQVRRPFFVRQTPLVPGEHLYAVGYPEGEFAITDGLFSRAHPPEALWDDVFIGWLQHSCSIAPGSSGGTLLDSHGRIVGMTIGGQTFFGVSFALGISSGVDDITLAYFRIHNGPPANPTVGVIGPPSIQRYNP